MPPDILLVDDDQLVRIAIQKLLTNNNYHVTTAKNGEQALELLATNHYNLILTDLIMDTVDGIQVLKKSKQLHPDTKVIIFTGCGEKASVQRAEKAGVDRILVKPCKNQYILSEIELCLKKE
jgi:DNA-binding NtrC family response regulator